MKRSFVLWFTILLLGNCQRKGATEKQPTDGYSTIDYVTVGSVFDTVQAPYVVDVTNQDKRIVFVGCVHIRDSTHQQFAAIRRYFNELQPQIAFNEGGQVDQNTRYDSFNEAVATHGETGAMKHLCDQAGIRLTNGDMEDEEEFAIMLKKYPKDKLFLYYVMERLIIPYLYGAYGNGPFDQVYQERIKSWFVDSGYPLGSDEQDVAYFKELYLKYVGTPFKAELNDKIELFDYINGGDCEFCAIGRASKVVRDSMLLDKIDRALNDYDRVMVTFGYGHSLAVEPALKQIVDRVR